jgi:hypothetical protein
LTWVTVVSASLMVNAGSTVDCFEAFNKRD